jgi:hypothetical protein
MSPTSRAVASRGGGVVSLHRMLCANPWRRQPSRFGPRNQQKRLCNLQARRSSFAFPRGAFDLLPYPLATDHLTLSVLLCAAVDVRASCNMTRRRSLLSQRRGVTHGSAVPDCCTRPLPYCCPLRLPLTNAARCPMPSTGWHVLSSSRPPELCCDV